MSEAAAETYDLEQLLREFKEAAYEALESHLDHVLERDGHENDSVLVSPNDLFGGAYSNLTQPQISKKYLQRLPDLGDIVIDEGKTRGNRYSIQLAPLLELYRDARWLTGKEDIQKTFGISDELYDRFLSVGIFKDETSSFNARNYDELLFYSWCYWVMKRNGMQDGDITAKLAQIKFDFNVYTGKEDKPEDEDDPVGMYVVGVFRGLPNYCVAGSDVPVVLAKDVFSYFQNERVSKEDLTAGVFGFNAERHKEGIKTRLIHTTRVDGLGGEQRVMLEEDALCFIRYIVEKHSLH